MHKVVGLARSSLSAARTPAAASSVPPNNTQVTRIVERLGIEPTRAWFLATLFEPDVYRSLAALETHDDNSLLEHYLTTGIEWNIAPSRYFDPNHAARSLKLTLPETVVAEDSIDEAAEASDSAMTLPVSAMRVWLDDQFDSRTWLSLGGRSRAGVAWFDDAFYRATYPDIDDRVANAYVHFITNGRGENRFPCARLRQLANTMLCHFPDVAVSVVDVLGSVPATHLDSFLSGAHDVELDKLFMPELYAGSLGLETSVPFSALFAHYLLQGWRDGLRPSVLFHEAWYREQMATADGIEPIGRCNPYLHWFFIGRAAGVVPTPLFESRHYLDMHQDIRRARPDAPFEHYLSNGIREHGRSASVYFDATYYKNAAGKLEHAAPLVDYIVRGQHLGMAPVQGFDLTHFETKDSWQSSPAEEAAIRINHTLHRLDQEPFASMTADIETLEPQIVRPYGPRRIRMPPMVHPETSLANEARPIGEALAGKQYDSIILIPHCRMAGSAKVSGALVTALANVTDSSRILVVTTDMSVFERADWYPDDVDMFDFSQYVENVPTERKTRALLDLVRGLRPKRLININSNLGWHLTTHYGRQLDEWMNLYVYLFCWDLDFKGNKGGYPIQWFLPTFDYCSGVFTDDATLRKELIARYAPSKAIAEKFVTLYEPATDRDISYREALIQRAAHRGKRRVFWCGRFDRQKRLDLLVQIAEAMPDVEFHVWGKRVMNDGPDYLAKAPDNIRKMGTYTCIDDVPIASCDCFLYTSGWDGMPSVLIEMATRNVPIVASIVGGVGELITDSTGWPITDVENVDAYVAALEEVLADPDDAIDRATRLREFTLDLCTSERYQASLVSTIEREIKPSQAPVYDDQESLTDGIVSDSHADAAGAIDSPTITAVLTAHGEGALAAISYRNFETACRHADANGLRVERIVMLDRPDRQTRLVFDDRADELRIIETDFGDQGAVRNLAAGLSHGEFIAFIDGDDLWSENWLTEGVRYLESAPMNVIAHPEFCRFFGGVQSVFVNIDQEDPAFRMDFLRHGNYWDAMCMARRETHVAFPYCKRRIRDGFAFEDWHWNCETIAGGQLHKVVADTLHLKRRRQSSQTTQASGNRSLMPVTALTDYSYSPTGSDDAGRDTLPGLRDVA